MASIQRVVSPLTREISYRAQVRVKGRTSQSATFPNKKEAERAEQQRIKSLVLNYDLQDADPDGIDQIFNNALPLISKHHMDVVQKSCFV